MSRVIKIGAVSRLPKQDDVPKARRVAAYVRVSTGFEEQLDSLAAQEDYYEKKNYSCVSIGNRQECVEILNPRLRI